MEILHLEFIKEMSTGTLITEKTNSWTLFPNTKCPAQEISLKTRNT